MGNSRALGPERDNAMPCQALARHDVPCLAMIWPQKLLKKEELPDFEMESEKKYARKRVISEKEYQCLLKESPRHLQRVLIALYETGMRKSEVLNLAWNRVDERAGVIRLLPEDDKEKGKKIIPNNPRIASGPE